jgi:hypothetical protein
MNRQRAFGALGSLDQATTDRIWMVRLQNNILWVILGGAALGVGAVRKFRGEFPKDLSVEQAIPFVTGGFIGIIGVILAALVCGVVIEAAKRRWWPDPDIRRSNTHH